MDDPASRANGLRRRMQETRSQLHHDVGGLVRDARGIVDWRRNVKRYPWLAIGAAAALGYFIVPKRRKPTHLDAETLAELARTKRLFLRVEGETEKPAKVTDTVAATVLAIVGREAATWLRRQVTDFVNAEMRRRSEARPRYPESESE
jgi:hypothetical protein